MAFIEGLGSNCPIVLDPRPGYKSRVAVTSTNPNPGGGVKWKIVAGWALIVGVTVFSVIFWFNLQGRPGSEGDSAEGSAPSLLHSLVLFGLGGFGLLAGAVAYLIVIQTQCFTFNFRRPVWSSAKDKIYVANILVPVIFMIGVGLLLAALVTPLLEQSGFSKDAAWLTPIIGSIVVLQLALVWVNLWAPLEKRLIARRLAAQGITPEQMQSVSFVGLSDPSRSSLKKFSMVEDDVGMLWVDAERLIYVGDKEQFDLTPEQVLAAERKVDAASTTALSGTAHLILRVRRPDGAERQIRLHTEGVWTLGQKRTAMNALAQRINEWLAAAPARTQ